MARLQRFSKNDAKTYARHLRWYAVGLFLFILGWIFLNIQRPWIKRQEYIPHSYTDTNVIQDYPEISSADQLKHHGLTALSESVELSTIHLHATLSDHEEILIEEVGALLPEPQPWNSNSNDFFPPEKVVLPLRLNRTRTNAQTVIFGVATLKHRLFESLETFAHWAAFTGTTIVALLPSDEPEPEDDRLAYSQDDIVAKAHRIGVNLEIHTSRHGYIERYVRLIEILHQTAKQKPGISWAALIDDDTFFPSMNRLMFMLGAYDAAKPQYVGGLSENLDSIRLWGLMGFGGAGIFLSAPLLAEIQPHIDRCVAEGAPNGDGKILRCIHRFTTTKLSVEHNLHQVDILGDPTGFYEAVRPIPLSLHHYKSLFKLDMNLISAVSGILGETQILQKYHFANNWWMTNGFSIVKYTNEQAYQPKDENEKEWFPPLTHRQGAMEKTFYITEETPQKFLHSMMPLAPKDERKLQFMLESAIHENQETMSLYYVRRVDGIGRSVIRVIWSIDPQQQRIT